MPHGVHVRVSSFSVPYILVQCTSQLPWHVHSLYTGQPMNLTSFSLSVRIGSENSPNLYLFDLSGRCLALVQGAISW